MGNFSVIPTPPGSTFESTLEALRSDDPFSFITEVAQTYGDIVRLPFKNRDLYLLNHPDLIREMFLGGSETFAKRKDADTEKSYLNGIAGMVPLFKENMIATYASTVVEATYRTHQRWQTLSQQQNTVVVDMYREMMQLTVPIVGEILFTTNVQVDSQAVSDALLKMDVGYGFDTVAAILGDTVPPVSGSPTSQGEAARAYLLQVMQELLDAYRHQPQTSPSLFSGLLNSGMSDLNIANTALRIFCAMHEVTVTTLSWTWYLLSQYPEVEAKLHGELDTLLGGSFPTSEEIEKLAYTKMILQEARRLYPTVWLTGRFVRHDVTLGNYQIPVDSIVLASQLVIHRDERYFPNPAQFDPWRWTPEAIETRPEFSFFPFSAGPRRCLGREFAWLEDTVILAILAGHWQGRLVPGQVLEPHPQKSLVPRHGLQMILHSR